MKWEKRLERLVILKLKNTIFTNTNFDNRIDISKILASNKFPFGKKVSNIS